MAKKIVFAVSVTLNAAFALLLSLFMGLGSIAESFSFISRPDYLNSALIVGVPSGGAAVGFGPAEISLGAGETAYLQFSAFHGGRQSNMAMEPLYDRRVIAVEQSGFGITIRAVSPGEAVLQLFSPSGFKDVAYVTVY